MKEELEKFHKNLCEILMPFTFMIVQRRFSPTTLLGIVHRLENEAKQIHEFTERNKK